jgi:hypothetical protein
LGSTSDSGASGRLLEYCLAGEPWPDSLLRDAIIEDDGRSLLRIVVERLADLFDPRLCDVYASLFSRVIEILMPEYDAEALITRYEQIRQTRQCIIEPRNVFVLSRVTLGADVAVTSVILDALKRRFSESAIHFIGSRKNYELFATDSRIRLTELPYPRSGSLRERIASAPRIDDPDAIVVDPDSRLSQLGLIPVCDDSRYFFFESRAYGGDSDDSIVRLTQRWCEEIFFVSNARPYIAPECAPMSGDIAVSLGVGDNPEKRLSDPFEENLLCALSATGRSVVVDEGAGGSEADRVQRIASQLGLATWRGAYAPFASMISQASLYVGYDSAGQHVAAACGVPLVSVFAGFPSDRMFQRWLPTGPGKIAVIKVQDRNTADVLERTLAAVQNLTL